jgi:hypothetical protein
VKAISIPLKNIAILVFLFALLDIPIKAYSATYTIVSDTTWTVADKNGNPEGFAQAVCLNAGSPSNCPTTAVPPPTLFGYPYAAWTADLSSIPGAKWIWSPNITGATSPAANAEFIFQSEFYLCGAPKKGQVSIAADNDAEVLVNNNPVPLTPVATNPAALSTGSIPIGFLTAGLNYIQVKVKNGANPADCGADQYKCNPAGFVFGASIEDALPSLPTCTDAGKAPPLTLPVGQSEPLSCPSGQTGSASRACICIGGNGFWGPTTSACSSPLPTCKGNSGGTFNVGQVETLACPSGQMGSKSHTCKADGSWTDPSGACAPLCIDGGKSFTAGQVEAVTCSPPRVGDQFRTCKPDGTWTDPSGTCSLQCKGSGGSLFTAGQTEVVACTAPKVGSLSHTCNQDGTWTNPTGTCVLPSVGPGDICGNTTQGDTGICPSGTTCQTRYYTSGHRSIGCFLFGIDCPATLRSTDWYCDP